MAVVKNELRADLKITGENAVKAGLLSTGRAAEKAGDDLRQMGQDAGFLQRKLLELKATQLAMVKTLNETGDLDLLKDIRKGRREISQFNRLVSELGGAGTEAGQLFSVNFAKASATAGPVLIGTLLAAAAGLLPGLGAMVAGAVTGVVGAGGIVGGVVAAAHDQRVKDAFKDLGPTLGAAFKTAGDPMVGPLVEALGVLKTEGSSVAHTLQAGFATLAPDLIALTKGLTGLVKEMLPGLLEAFENARPVLRSMGQELPKIGSALGKFFQITSEDSDSAVLGFEALSALIQNLLIYGAKFVSILGTVYKISVEAGEKATSALETVTKWLPLTTALTGALGATFLKVSDNQHELFKGLLDDLQKANVSTGSLGSTTQQLTYVQYGLGVALEGNTEELQAQRDAMYGLINTQLSMLGSTIAFERGLDELTESVKENGKSLNIREEAGRRNVEILRQEEQEILALTQAEYDRVKALGATDAEAQRAADTLREQLTKALRDQAIALLGNSAELQKLLAYLDQLNGKQVTWTLVQQGGVTIGAKVQGGTILSGADMEGARAGGGDVQPHKLYRVNESGVELLATGSQSGHVYSAAQTAAMMSGASGGARPQVNLYPPPPSGNALVDALMAVLWPQIIERIRVDGGDLTAVGAA